MSLAEFGKKLNAKLEQFNQKIDKVTADLEGQLNSGLNSVDSSINGGLQQLGAKVDEAIGVKEEVVPEGQTPFNDSAVQGLRPETDTSVHDVIREPVGPCVPTPIVSNPVDTAEKIMGNSEVAPVVDITKKEEVAPIEENKVQVNLEKSENNE